MVPDMAAPAESPEVVGVVIRGVAVDVVTLKPAISAAPLALPPVAIEHEPAEPRPPMRLHTRFPTVAYPVA